MPASAKAKTETKTEAHMRGLKMSRALKGAGGKLGETLLPLRRFRRI